LKNAIQVIFRRLTAADFYNINKPKGSEARGGGQSYIDFPTSAIKFSDWEKFFSGQKTLTTQSGPLWRFAIHSLGMGKSQSLEIGQRRAASFNIRAQKLGTGASNRVYAWHPQYSNFPSLKNPDDRSGVPNLVIYLVKTDSNEYWAGFFQAPRPVASWQVDQRLQPMFTRDQGTIYLDPPVMFDENDAAWPFRLAGPSQGAGSSSIVSSPDASKTTGVAAKVVAASRFKQKSEDQVISELFDEDIKPSEVDAVKKQVTLTILKRNTRIVAVLKSLYGGKCQITGERYTFKKLDGEFYCEAHHLIPLGEGGADSPYNIIIVSPLIHRMLHYGEVSGFDLSQIKADKLKVMICGTEYMITWHPKHAQLVNSISKEGQ
jgi:5-methylcytosine-specific restriction protein A